MWIDFMAKHYGIKIFFGYEEIPSLPSNLRVERSATESVTVHDDKNKKSFIIADNPPRLVPILERRKAGACRTVKCDFDNPVLLN
jgi:hypothetical protein